MPENLLDRVAAAEFLGISTRTLDRYVRDKKLNFLRKNGKVFFRIAELTAWKNQREAYTAHLVESHTEMSAESSAPERYKILYEAAQNDLRNKEQLIFEMHRRLGFLEAEVKNSVPLLESREARGKLETELSLKTEKINALQRKLRHQRISRIATLLFFLLALSAILFFSVLS